MQLMARLLIIQTAEYELMIDQEHVNKQPVPGQKSREE